MLTSTPLSTKERKEEKKESSRRKGGRKDKEFVDWNEIEVKSFEEMKADFFLISFPQTFLPTLKVHPSLCGSAVLTAVYSSIESLMFLFSSRHQHPLGSLLCKLQGFCPRAFLINPGRHQGHSPPKISKEESQIFLLFKCHIHRLSNTCICSPTNRLVRADH